MEDRAAPLKLAGRARFVVRFVFGSLAGFAFVPIGAALEKAASGLSRPLDIHVCVDTGIGRVGVPHPEAAPLIRDLAGRKNVRIAGVMMTFTEDQAFDQEQLARFTALTSELAASGAISAGLLA